MCRPWVEFPENQNMEVQGGADRISVSDRGGWGYDDENGGRAILFAMPDIGVRCASLLRCAARCLPRYFLRRREQRRRMGTQFWVKYIIWRSIPDQLGDEKLNGGGWCHGVIRPWNACRRGISCLVRL